MEMAVRPIKTTELRKVSIDYINGNLIKCDSRLFFSPTHTTHIILWLIWQVSNNVALNK